MIVKLISPHFFRGDLYYEKDQVLGAPGGTPLPEAFSVTHEMEGLDDEAKVAVETALKRWNDPIHSLPITLEEPQVPVPPTPVSARNLLPKR